MYLTPMKICFDNIKKLETILPKCKSLSSAKDSNKNAKLLYLVSGKSWTNDKRFESSEPVESALTFNKLKSMQNVKLQDERISKRAILKLQFILRYFIVFDFRLK